MSLKLTKVGGRPDSVTGLATYAIFGAARSAKADQ